MTRQPFLNRFWARVTVTESGCWEWTGCRLPPKPGAASGYGVLGSGRTNAKGHPFNLYAHRLSWEIAHGEEVPDGKYVCHHCDNPCCIRPDHLFLGTASDNTRDMYAKGRGRRPGARPNVDLTGATLGTRTVERLVGHDGHFFLWATRCACGREEMLSRPDLATLCTCTPWPNHHMITIRGVSRRMTDWARLIGVSKQAIEQRLKNGWSEEAACTTQRSAGAWTPKSHRRYRRLRKQRDRLQQEAA